MSEKKTNRVSLFFSDQDLARFVEDAYDAGREPHDFLRFLWLEHRKQKVREWADACKQKEMELGGSGNDDDGFPQTVAGFPR